ncbi:MAG: bifunctional hydroxymethylpyrimidine kinase/phosphomethylpyrimidine kinase [Desulfovibrio sp.]
MNIPSVLTIAGSDSGGGAGIQADLKTITALGGYGASVITALTAQNTIGVTGIHAPPADFVALQLAAVLDDIPIHGAKTGMLFSAEIIQAITPLLQAKKFPLVVDPVCVSTSGSQLLESSAVDAMIKYIFPLADVLTPNLPETKLFTGIDVASEHDARKAARVFLEMGCAGVLIKGGHSENSVITDWFFDSSGGTAFTQQRVNTKNTHGTGCTLSAAIATGLAFQLSVPAAISQAQKYLNAALRTGFDIGAGSGPPNHLVRL